MWLHLDYLKNKEEQSALVAMVDNKIVGFTMFGKNREAKYDYQSEIYGIYLLEEFQRQGMGYQMFERSVHWLKEKGYINMILWVLKDNLSAISFYEKMGGKIVAEKTICIEEPLTALGYGYQL